MTIRSKAINIHFATIRTGKRRERFQAESDLIDLVKRNDLTYLRQVLPTHTSKRVRRAITGIIGEFRDHRSIRCLIDRVQHDPDDRVRRHALRALGRIGTDDDYTRVSIIAAMGSDSSPSVRMHAAHALVEIFRKKAIVTITQAIVALKTLESEADRRTVKYFFNQCLARAYVHANVHPGGLLTRPAEVRRGETTVGWFRGTKYLLYTPLSYRSRFLERGLSQNPLLISVHGTTGTAEPYLKLCIDAAEQYRHMVIAPHFDYGTFPDYGNLNPWPGFQRADLRLLQIIDDLGERAGIRTQRFNIFGHSQGGQFVHRFVLAHPERIHRAAACGSGNYVDPTANEVFPWGIDKNPFMPDVEFNFGRLVRSSLVIIVGTNDLAMGEDVPKRRQFDAIAFASQVQQYASEHHFRSSVSTRYVIDGEHSGIQNYPMAIKHLMRKMDSVRYNDF